MGKNLIVMAGAAVGLLLWTAAMVVDKKVELKTNKFLTMLTLLAVWGWIGWFRLKVGVRMRSITDVGGIGTLTALLAWFWLWRQTKSKEDEQQQLNWLTAAGVVVAVTSIVVFLIPVAKLPILWPKDNPMLSIEQTWSLTGSLLSEGILLLFLIIEWGKRLMKKLKGEDAGSYIVEAVVTGGLALVLMLDLYRIYKTGWINLDRNSAWVIAVETFKRSPIWGIGLGNFVEAFNRFRPEAYNLTKFWSNGFRLSSMGILQVWTEMGGVGMVILGLMGLRMAKLKKDFSWTRLLVVGLAAMFLPMNLVTLMLLVWAVAMVDEEGSNLSLKLKFDEKDVDIAKIGLGLGLMAVSVFGGYWLGRILMGEIYLRQSLLAAAKNDGGGTYNLQIKAIGINAYVGEYRRIYSQTNLALAKTILSNKDITEEDKQKASTLIQQAVREGKSAIALDEMDPNYWVNLAAIYRQIIGVVDGSADWSFQAYQQAAVLDPVNPLIKLDMGGLLYAANRFDDADRVFEQVVTVKPDFANGWYNWAYTAKQTGKLADAVTRMTQALTLVPADSGDYAKANKDLETWKKELDEAIKKQNAELAARQAAAATPTPTPESLKTAEPLPTGNRTSKVAVPTGELAPPTGQPTATPTN